MSMVSTYIPGSLRRLCFLVVVALLSSAAMAQRGAITAPRALDQLAQEANVIVQGAVVSAKVEPHPQLNNLTTVVVTLNVQDTLKGAPRKSLVFRQYIWDIRDRKDAAGYRKGQELLLLLGPVSKYGLTSPVGLEQGRFRVLRDSSGRETAVNGRGNAGLFQATEARAQARGIRLSTAQQKMVRGATGGPLPLSDLKDAIRAFVEAK